MLRVHLTGRVSVSNGEVSLDEAALAGRLGRLALVRLTLEHHPIDRDRLVDDLWGEATPTAVDSVLNATFSRLRASLNELGLDGKAILRTSKGIAEFRRPLDCWVDIETALRSIDTAEGALRRDDVDAAWAAAVVANSIARRPLLAGVDRVWLDAERARLRDILERSYRALTEVWLRRDDPLQSSVMARELIRCAPYSEESHRRLVVALLEAGDRAAAAHAVRQWESVLVEELGLPLDDRLRSLLR